MIAEEIRLAYAARLIDRALSQGRHDLAFSILNYTVKNAAEFGVRKPTVEERKQINGLKHASTSFPYLAEIRSLAANAFREPTWEMMVAAEYLATLLTDDGTEALTLTALAIADIHVQNLLLVADGNLPTDQPVDAVPIAPLALAAYAAGAISLEKAKADAFSGQAYLEAQLIEPRHLAKIETTATSTALYADSNPNDGGQPPAEPINAVRFSPKLTQALRGQLSFSYDRTPEVTVSPAQDNVLQPLIDTLHLAQSRDVHGLHFAIRDKNPRHGQKIVHQALATSENKPVIVAASDTNDLLSEIISHQIICLLQTNGGRLPPLVIVDAFDLLSAPEDIQQIDMGVDDNTPSIQQVFDTLIMTEQKVILRDKADAFLSPVIWIVEDARPISEELIGTISEIVNLPSDELSEKAIAIVAIGERYGFPIDEATSRSVAACVNNVEDIDGVIKLASLRGNTDDLVRRCRKLLAGSKTNQTIPIQAPDRFDLRYVRSPKDIPNFVEKLMPLRDKPIGILLHGEPGTSKTSVARYIAERMGMKVVSKKYSEISGWRVSDTEKGISRAFEQAVAEDAFLILDECDSLLRSRALATHQWEKSVVNEALTCMDNHPLPFACTTNFLKELDPAVLRRFRHRLELIGMDCERARLAWVNVLQLPAAEFPDDGTLENLTIADFALVANQMDDLCERNAKFAIKALEAEKADKTASASAPIGFLAKQARI